MRRRFAGLAGLWIAAAQVFAGSFPVRMVKLGSPSDPAVWDHLRFCAGAGFNAVWIYSHEAGRWTEEDAPRGPFLAPAFLDVARWCREHGVRMTVSVNPVSNSRGQFVFHESEGERRIRR